MKERESSRLDLLCVDLLDDCEQERARRDLLRAEVNELFNQRAELQEESRDLGRLVAEMRAEIAAAGFEVLDDDEEVSDAAGSQTAA